MIRKEELLVGLFLLLAGCATTQGRYAFLGSPYTALPVDAPIEVFQEKAPIDRAFIRISRLDAHFEKTGFMSTSLKEALPELIRQARLSGAQGIIDIHESRSSVMETNIYHVTATGIRFSDGVADGQKEGKDQGNP